MSDAERSQPFTFAMFLVRTLFGSFELAMRLVCILFGAFVLAMRLLRLPPRLFNNPSMVG